MTRSRWFLPVAAALLAAACTTKSKDDSVPQAGAPGGPNMMIPGQPGAPNMPGAQPAAGAPSTMGNPITAGGTGGASGSGTVTAGGGSPAAGTDGTMTMAGSGGAEEAGSGEAGGGGPPEVVMDEAMGCGTTKLLPNPDDTSMRGPWPVGEKTVKFGRFKAVEIMYPATPGSEAGKEELKYDLRDWLPGTERSKVPDAEASMVGANTFRDLPLDETHGPYPVVILVHGTGAFRFASGPTQAHWASRGFVVVAAEHPNLYLTDYMGSGCGIPAPALDLDGDVDSEIEALTNPTGDLAFLAGHIDMKLLALAGHSAGAFSVAQFSGKPGVQVVIPLAGTHEVDPSSTLKSVMFVSGADDTVLPYATGFGSGTILYPGTTVSAYTGSPGPPGVRKRVLSITGGGHLAVTDLCQDNAMGKNPLEVAEAHNVCGLGILPTLFDCGTVEREAGESVVNDITAGVLEETLHCHDRSATISAIKDRHPGLVSDFREEK